MSVIRDMIGCLLAYAAAVFAWVGISDVALASIPHIALAGMPVLSFLGIVTILLWRLSDRLAKRTAFLLSVAAPVLSVAAPVVSLMAFAVMARLDYLLGLAFLAHLPPTIRAVVFSWAALLVISWAWLRLFWAVASKNVEPRDPPNDGPAWPVDNLDAPGGGRHR